MRVLSKLCSQHRVAVQKDWVMYQELTADNARKALHRLFARKPWPDAILAANDLTALAALSFAKEKGIAVPQELRIVGYSNDPRSSIVTPSITTVEQFPGRIGTVIVSELLKLLKNDRQAVAIDAVPIITPVELIRTDVDVGGMQNTGDRIQNTEYRRIHSCFDGVCFGIRSASHNVCVRDGRVGLDERKGRFLTDKKRASLRQ